MMRLDTTTANLLAGLARLSVGINQLKTGFGNIAQALQRSNVDTVPVPVPDIHELREELDTIDQCVKTLTVRLERLHELVRTSVLLSSTLESDQVLENVIDALIEISGAERAYVVLRGDESQDLTVQAARNYDEETISPEQASFSRGMVNAAIERREIVMAYTPRSVVAIPMIIRDKIIGALYADSRAKDAPFKKDLLPLLTAFAGQAAIAIENSRLFSNLSSDLEAAKCEARSLRIQIGPNHTESESGKIVETGGFKRLQDLARDTDA